ncbi:MAG: aldehyde dehydrogenase family protein [Pseudomonadota bacterium]|nr:aldehyde dehydrogenase family protein [Pseudomonadota bacterium]
MNEQTISINPATLEPNGVVDNTPLDEFPGIFDQARQVQKAWSNLSFKARAQHIRKMADYIRDNADEIAQSISNDNGKLKIDALVTEVIPCIGSINWYTKNASKVLKSELVLPSNLVFANKVSRRFYEPVGVVGIISPWNYPLSIPFGEIIMALMAGNAVVLKVAADTPTIGLLIERILSAAQLPKGLFTLVTGSGSKVVAGMLDNGVNKIFFTGSTTAGKAVMKACAEYLVPCSLELGGNDAMVVLDDADIEKAVNGALWAGCQNAGQSCGGVKRIYVMESVYDAFVEMAIQKVSALRHGNNSYDADIGAVTTEKQLLSLKKDLDAALEQGARVVAQSQPVGGQNGFFFPATLLVDVEHDMPFIQDEIFGPFLPVVKVHTEHEAIQKANDSQYGLTASVWTKSKKRGKAVAAQLEAGAVTINDHLYTHGLAETEWGGPKDSGIGRTHGKLGLLEMVEPKVVNWDWFAVMRKNPWWFPFNEKKYQSMKKSAELMNPRSPFHWLFYLVTYLPTQVVKSMIPWKVKPAKAKNKVAAKKK